ncbi:MAG: pyruvate kinase [Candidatus Thorarchaeota archaeon]
MKFDETRTKIVCTLGPASRSEDTIAGMIEKGMDVVRLNLSHADHPTAKKDFERVRSIDDCIPVLFDLQGPKIRIGELKEPLKLISGAEFTLSTEDFVGDETRVSISHKELPDDVSPGSIIAINDGIVRLRVKEIKGEEIITEVIHGGPISSRKGVNIPGIRLSCGIPTEKDVKDLDLAVELEPDFIALSFVVDEYDIIRVKEILEGNGLTDVYIVSKIEHKLAIQNYDKILKESRAVMIARGDLGIEVPIEDVPILQRDLIRKANIWARPTIVATHMLESMTHESVPTRAEVSDVAHAVLDRTDAVMLSAETAVGHDPVAAVEMMNKIARNAEKRITRVSPTELISPSKLIVEIVATQVYNIVDMLQDKIDGIVTATRSGFTARWISKFRPPTHTFAVTNDKHVIRGLRLLWGVHPVYFDQHLSDVDAQVQAAVRAVHAEGFLNEEKDVVFTSGIRQIPGRTNIVGVFHIKDLLRNV